MGRQLEFRVEDHAVVARSADTVLFTLRLEDAIERALEHAGTSAASPEGQVPRELMRVEFTGPGIEGAFEAPERAYPVGADTVVTPPK